MTAGSCEIAIFAAVAEIPDQEALSEEQNNHLMCWMLESLQQERLSSRLFHQPKLAHLIEPLQQKLEKEGDAVTRELLDQILQQTPPTN